MWATRQACLRPRMDAFTPCGSTHAMEPDNSVRLRLESNDRKCLKFNNRDSPRLNRCLARPKRELSPYTLQQTAEVKQRD